MKNVYQIHKLQLLPISLSQAWAFFSSPNNLALITPPQLDFKVLTPQPDEIYEGMKIEYRVKPLLGVPLRWQTEICQVEKEKSFTDVQRKGPYRLWKHTHYFSQVNGGVLMRDEIYYQLPLGFVGRWMHKLVVKKSWKRFLNSEAINFVNFLVMLLVNILLVLGAFLGMEAVAWLTHKYVMHGLLWILHKDHHKKESAGFFEHNDFFFLIFALPGIAGLFFGMQNNYNALFWIGLGITLYGFAYFLVHDIFIHQRFRLFRKTNNAYFKAIRRAHKMHHKHLDKQDGECFGMLWVPLKFFRKNNANA